MTCQQMVEILCDYVDGSMPEATRAELEAHLGDCPPCVNYVQSYKATAALGRALPKCCEMPPELEARLRAFVTSAAEQPGA